MDTSKNMTIQDSFGSVSKVYDSQRRKLIPCFEELYTSAIPLLKSDSVTPRILDIGAGTGLFSSYLLERFPKANITLIDLSEEMLKVARERFKGYDFEYIVDDYTAHPFEEKFDFVISALSIHHLTAKLKFSLFEKIYSILLSGGVFLNADQVLSPSAELEYQYATRWRHHVEQSGLSAEDIQATFARTLYDDPSTLAEHELWLKEAGFPVVDIVFKHYHFATIYAKKGA